jgi:hypothetical protein
MRWHREHAVAAASFTVPKMVLHLEVQFVDRRFEERRRREYRADHIRPMPSDDFRIARSFVRLLDLAGEIRHVPRSIQVMPVQTGGDLKLPGI